MSRDEFLDALLNESAVPTEVRRDFVHLGPVKRSELVDYVIRKFKENGGIRDKKGVCITRTWFRRKYLVSFHTWDYNGPLFDRKFETLDDAVSYYIKRKIEIGLCEYVPCID